MESITSIKYGRIKINLILVEYCLLIFFTIVNSNNYLAAMSFVLIPQSIITLLAIISLRLIDIKQIIRYIPILIIIIVTILSTVTSDVVQFSPNTISFIWVAVLYFLLTVRYLDKNTLVAILKFYAYFTLIISICLIINLFLSYSVVNGRVSLMILGVRKDENYLSGFLCFGFFYFLFSLIFGSRKKKYLFFCLSIFLAVYMTGSRGALITLLVISFLSVMKFFLIGGFNLKKVLFIVLFGILGFLFYYALSQTNLFDRMFNADGYSNNIRLTIWGYAIEAFERRPWIGSGIQSGTYFAQLHVRWYTHSCFVDLITTVGIIGAICYVIQYLQCIIVKKNNIIFMIALFSSLFLPLMFINGYETITFWMPMMMVKIVSDFCRENIFHEVLI